MQTKNNDSVGVKRVSVDQQVLSVKHNGCQ